MSYQKDVQYYKFCLYGFFKNLQFFNAFFVLFLLQRQLNYTQIGSLYAIREIITNISEVPTGIIADMYGRRNTLAFSFLLYIVSFLIFLTATHYVWFIPAFVFYGLADAFRSGTHKAMIMKYLEQNNWSASKISYYGHTRACSQRGSAIAALIAGAIVFYTGNYKSIFILSIIPYFINFILILSYPKSLNIADEKSQNRRNFIKNFKQILIRPKVWGIIHSAAVYTAYLKAIKDYIQIVMKNVALLIPLGLAFSVEEKQALMIGIMYFFLYLMTSIASAKSAYFVHKIKQSVAYKTLFFGWVAGMLTGYLFYREIWILSLAGFVLLYLVENVRKPILTGFLSNNVPNDKLASVLSVQSLYRTILTGVIAVSFGYLTDTAGLGQALIIISAGLLFVSIFIEIIFKFNDKNK